MTGEMTLSWVMLLMLGAFHGINPGMGWLFAVALGMQERRRSAVLWALLPLGLGHGLAIAAAILVAVLVGVVVPLHYLRWLVAAILLTFGLIRIFRQRHPRWSGMRVGMAGLTLWSFLMATAHGAGLMVMPVFLTMAIANEQSSCHTPEATMSAPTTAMLATSVHALGYFIVTALVAMLVFEKLGLGLLRKAWFNLDLIWAGTLVLTGALTLLM